RAARRHVLARLRLAERRVPRALLELPVHVLHEERHPPGARLHESDPKALELLEEAAVDAADQGDHLLGRVRPRVQREEVVEAVRIAGPAARRVERDGHAEPLGLLVDRPEERIADVTSRNEGRNHEPDQAELGYGAIQLARGPGGIEVWNERDAPESRRI